MRAFVIKICGIDIFVCDVVVDVVDFFDEIVMGFFLELLGAIIIDSLEIAIIDGFLADDVSLEWAAVFGAVFALETVWNVSVLNASVFVVDFSWHVVPSIY